MSTISSTFSEPSAPSITAKKDNPESKKDWMPTIILASGLGVGALTCVLAGAIGAGLRDPSVGTENPDETRGLGTSLAKINSAKTVRTNQKTVLSLSGSTPYQLASFFVKFRNVPADNYFHVLVTATKYLTTSSQVACVDISATYTNSDGENIPSSVLENTNSELEFVEDKCPAGIHEIITLGKYRGSYYNQPCNSLCFPRFSIKLDKRTRPLTVDGKNTLVVRTSSNNNVTLRENEQTDPYGVIIAVSDSFGVLPRKFDFNLVSSTSVLTGSPCAATGTSPNSIYAFNIEGITTEYITCSEAKYLNDTRMEITWDMVRSSPSIA